VSTVLTKKIAPLFAAVALACAGAAQAQSLLDGSTYASPFGRDAGTVNGVSLAVGGSNFATKFVNGWGCLGVSGAPSGSEIDLGQSITMSFAAQAVSDFSVAPLHRGSDFGDHREKAQVADNPSEYGVPAVHSVPEPETYALLAAGLGAVGFVARRRRQR